MLSRPLIGAVSLAAAVTVLLASSASPALAAGCPNEALRTGASSQLPECRAYELVTPVNTNGSPPVFSIGSPAGVFETQVVTPNPMVPADTPASVLYEPLGGGSIPGLEGNGRPDVYVATRESTGWTSKLVSPSAAEAESTELSSISPDHLFSDYHVIVGSAGTLGGEEGNYVRGPGGEFTVVGQGSDGVVDRTASMRWITPGGGHEIFTSVKQLTADGGVGLGPEAAESSDASYDNPGVAGVYDRTPLGLYAVSLLPGDVTPGPEDTTWYRGTSLDGTGILFNVNGTMYLRRNDVETIPVAGSESVTAGTKVTCIAEAEGNFATTTFQWLRNGVPIGGANSASYTTTAADEGAYVECRTTQSQPEAGSIADSEAAFAVRAHPGQYSLKAPASIPSPTSSEEPIEEGGNGGQTLTCEPDAAEWKGGPTFSYRWYRNGSQIAGAKGRTYKLTKADVATPAYFQCEVIGSNGEGAIARSSGVAFTNPPPNVNLARATVPGFLPVARGLALAGISPGAEKITYVRRNLNPGAEYEKLGDIFVFDSRTGQTTQLTTGENSQVVNVSADGSHVYFISPELLDGSHGEEGANNFYVTDGSSVEYIGDLSEEDLTNNRYKLNFWIATFGAASTAPANTSGPLASGSRTNPDGDVIAFESQTQLTSYDNEDPKTHERMTEIYRFDTLAPEGSRLTCVSCDPSGAPPVSNAQFTVQADNEGEPGVPLTSTQLNVENLTEDGEAVYFETADPLVPEDVDGVQDVYQWKDGKVSLISSGKSTAANWIFGVSPDGHDVYFDSYDRLVPQKTDSTEALYDARVDGGFPSAEAAGGTCEGRACQGAPAAPPSSQQPASGARSGNGNLPPNCRAGRLQAQRLLAKAKRLRRQARHSRNGKTRRAQAKRAEGQAKRAAQGARRCTQRNRGAAK